MTRKHYILFIGCFAAALLVTHFAFPTFASSAVGRIMDMYYTVTSGDPEWLRVSTDIARDGDVITVDVDENTTPAERTGPVTLHIGGTTRTITVMQAARDIGDWVIGNAESDTSATVGAGSTYRMKDFHSVYIGKGKDANGNAFTINGKLIVKNVHVGEESLNTGNTLVIGEDADIGEVGDIWVASGSGLVFEENLDSKDDFLSRLNPAKLHVKDKTTGEWVLIDKNNFDDYFTIDDGSLVVATAEK